MHAWNSDGVVWEERVGMGVIHHVIHPSPYLIAPYNQPTNPLTDYHFYHLLLLLLLLLLLRERKYYERTGWAGIGASK